MNVLLINGSPHEKGCTYTALSLIAGELNKAGIDTEILHVGGKPVGGCIGCGGCRSGNGCVFGGVVNEAIEKAKTADGFVFGSPVHYASASWTGCPMQAANIWPTSPPPSAARPAAPALPPHWTSWSSTRSSSTCRWSTAPTGPWCTAPMPSRCCRTPRAAL